MYETLAIIGVVIGGLFALVFVLWVLSFLARRARAGGGARSAVGSSSPAPAPPRGPGGDLLTRLVHGPVGNALLPLTAGLLMPCGLLLWTTAQDVAVGEASRGWPTARGVIATSLVETEGGPSDPRYRAHIIYGYAIAAHPYVGRQVRWGGVAADEVQETVASYPKGKDVQVRYAPDDPRLAVLEPGADPSARRFMWSCFVVVVLAAPVALVLLGARLATRWRRRRRR